MLTWVQNRQCCHAYYGRTIERREREPITSKTCRCLPAGGSFIDRLVCCGFKILWYSCDQMGPRLIICWRLHAHQVQTMKTVPVLVNFETPRYYWQISVDKMNTCEVANTNGKVIQTVVWSMIWRFRWNDSSRCLRKVLLKSMRCTPSSSALHNIQNHIRNCCFG